MKPIYIVIFFAFFMTSRFFSETIRILPKFVDVIDIPFIVFLTLVALLSNTQNDVDVKDKNKIQYSIIIILITVLLSMIINMNTLLLPAGILFTIGFLEGPLLFFSLNRVIQNTKEFASQAKGVFYILFIINIFIVIFIDIPLFTITGNPDVISGTYGLNCYYFSIFLLICGGFLFGDALTNNRSNIALFAGQGFIFVTFFLLQYRAALPFFILSYVVLLFAYFGKKVGKLLFMLSIFFILASIGIHYVKSTVQRSSALKYDDWQVMANNPLEQFQHGKFQAYPQTYRMMTNEPLSILFGVGPGNYVSRAYYSFSYELMRSDKGVGKMLKKIFKLKGPRFTQHDIRYLRQFRGQVVFGSYQLSNPNSSYIASIAELGLFGGLTIIFLYLYMLKRSLQLFRHAKASVPEYVPLSAALVMSSTYLCGLAFLDNYWEMSRATIPVWLLFWVTSTGIHTSLKKTDNESETYETTMPKT